MLSYFDSLRTICSASRFALTAARTTHHVTRTTPWTVQTARYVCENRVSTKRLQIKLFPKPHPRPEALLAKWGLLPARFQDFDSHRVISNSA